MESYPVLREPPGGFTLSGVGVRLATPGERPLRRDARRIRGADHVPAVRGNASETLGIPGAIDREREDGGGGLPEGLNRVHGRLERRSIRVLTPPKGLASHPGVRRTARDTGTGGRDHTGTAYPITSPGAGKVLPR